jgi:hypothetical protein
MDPVGGEGKGSNCQSDSLCQISLNFVALNVTNALV